MEERAVFFNFHLSFDYFFAIIIAMIKVAVILCWIRYRLKRRRLYELMGKIKSPRGYPLIGHPLMFSYPPLKLLNKVTDYFFEYGPNFSMWLLNAPLVAIGKVEDLEIVMQNRNCVEKSFFYDFTKESVGEGLFTAQADKWRKFRKLIQPTFHTKILRNFLPLFAISSTICVNEILPKYEYKRDVDWLEIFTLLNVDTLSLTTMAVETNAQRTRSEFGYHLQRGIELIFSRMTNILLYPELIFKL